MKNELFLVRQFSQVIKERRSDIHFLVCFHKVLALVNFIKRNCAAQTSILQTHVDLADSGFGILNTFSAIELCFVTVRIAAQGQFAATAY